MPNIDIPFVRGQSEAVDPKLLPQGYFSSATNIRFKKDGRVGSRFGYTALRTSLVQAAGDFGPKRSIFITQRNGTTTPAGAIERHTDGTFTDLGSSSSTSFGTPFGGSNLTCPSRLAAVRNIKYTTVASDMIYDSGNKRLWVLANDYDYVNSIDNGVTLTVYDAGASGGGYTGFSLLKQLRVANTGFRNAKLVQVSTTIYAIGANGNNIDYAKFDAAALTAGATGTIVTAAAGRAFSFDISVNNQNPSASFLFCYESNGISLQFGTVVTNTMTFLNTATQAIANPVRPAITTGASNNHIYLVWAENAGFNAGNVFYREDIVNGANVTAKTTIDSSGLAVGFPVAGQNSSHNVSFCWNRSDSSTATYNTFSGMNLVAGLTVVSKPANLFAGACCAWYANYGTSGQTSRFGTYKLLDVESFAQSAMGAVCEAIACQHEALPGAYYVTSATNQDRMENRRNLVTVQSTLIESGTLAFATALPVLDRTRFGVDVIRAEYSPIGSRLLPGKINGQLIFSGARVFEFDGGNLFESGLADGPEYFTAADAGAGALGAGTYQYVALFEYKDAFGRRHQSPPSAPVSITIAASHNVTLSFQGPAFSSRLGPASPNTGAAAPGVTVAIYRTTQATPTIFQLVNSTQTIQVGASGHYDSTIYTYTDSTVDATIAANEILYTQGQRGGLSGLLQNDEPPPCRCLAIGNNRVLAAGLEDVQSYQFSKRIFPGEPLQWANNSAYKGRVDGDITGAWCLDGVYYVGTRDSIYVISGDGPDDNGAGGSFNDPVKLPADIGFYNQRSMVETPAGLFFQGRPDRIYLLPRGGGPRSG